MSDSGTDSGVLSARRTARAAVLSFAVTCAFPGAVCSAVRGDVRLELVGQWGGVTEAIAVQGDRAYLGVGPRLAVLDITDPAAPVELGRSDLLQRHVSEVVVSGDHAYVSSGTLQILDVSDPTAPTIIGEYGKGDTLERIESIEVSGDFAYVGYSDHFVHVVDVSDPRVPVRVGVCEVITAKQIIVSGDYAYIRCGYPGLAILDISDPSAPTVIGTYGIDVDYIDQSGEFVYALVDVGPRALVYIDVSNPASPQFVDVHLLANWPEQIKVRDNLAYLLADDGIDIYDVSTPRPVPTYLGGMLQREYEREGGFDFAGGHVIVTTRRGGFYTIDVSDPAAAITVGDFVTGGAVGSLDVSGRYAFVAGVCPNLHVLDIADPSLPTLVADIHVAAC
jgi:hypothetical protein